jgi:hypothetical protein
MKKLFVNLILLLGLGLPIYGLAGNEHGGTDLAPDWAHSAWFVGSAPIKYCLKVASDFGVPESDVIASLEKAAETWRKYMKERFIYPLPSALHLALNLEFLSLCDGSEDLTLYFGVTPAHVLKIKNEQYSNPVAFSHRSRFDLNKGWGRGFIWVAASKSVNPEKNFPNWGLKEKLRGILTHELGHVLGCGHMKDTIMDEKKLVPMLSQESAISELRLTQLDWGREIKQRTHFRYLGAKRIVSANVFTKLVGRAPKGEIGSSIFWKNELEAEIGSLLGTLTIEDALGEKTFELTQAGDLWWDTTHPDKIFRSVKGVGNIYEYHSWSRGFGKITAHGGKDYLVSYDRNLMHAIRLSMFIGQTETQLFLSRGSK